jgi:hypothetical protein
MERRKVGITIARFAALFVAALYLFSGTLKLSNPHTFLLDLQSFQIFPYPLTFALAYTIPWIEILSALAGLFRTPFARGGWWLLWLMNFGFVGFVIWMLWVGTDLNCGCFGKWLVFTNPWVHLGFNLTTLGILTIRLREAK